MFFVQGSLLFRKIAHCSSELCERICQLFPSRPLILTHCDHCRDPQGLRTDAELISVLQRAWLLPKDGPANPVAEAKFSLDSAVGDEGQPLQTTDLQH